ncbi:MAG: PH domain-containing protein [Acidimicrobiia bacterium]|nr:PH domain-containing protein [Acidimicrobiia bacterium]
MPYPEKMLNDGESVTVDLHPHWWFFAEPVVVLLGAIAIGIVVLVGTDDGSDVRKWLGLVSLALIVISGIWLIARYLQWGTTNFVITNDRVIYRSGVIAKHGIEIPLERVNNVMISQRIVERMLSTGDLMIESGGEDGQQRFTDIREPDRVKNLIHAMINENERNAFRGTDGGGFVASGSDVASQLEKLEGMRDRGTLSPDEFEAQKRRLLGG